MDFIENLDGIKTVILLYIERICFIALLKGSHEYNVYIAFMAVLCQLGR